MHDVADIRRLDRRPLINLRSSALLLAAMIGLLLGIGGFTFKYAEGFSYFSADPEACVNCHVMGPQYDSWQKSSHRRAAACVDCHLPHGLLAKYLAKAENGYHHSRAFTLQNFHEPIMITSRNSRILQKNCIDCHHDMVRNLVEGATNDPDAITCVHCHQAVGHGEPTGLGGGDRSESGERTTR
jgi:cytochrome c nitrite reductase small subunit